MGGPNPACGVGLPLEHGCGVPGGLGGVLAAPARDREKLGLLFIGFEGSGCLYSELPKSTW